MAELARVKVVAQGGQAVTLVRVEGLGSAQTVEGCLGGVKATFDADETACGIADNRFV